MTFQNTKSYNQINSFVSISDTCAVFKRYYRCVSDISHAFAPPKTDLSVEIAVSIFFNVLQSHVGTYVK